MREKRELSLIGSVLVIAMGIFLILYPGETKNSLEFSGHEFGISESIGFKNSFSFKKDEGDNITFKIKNLGDSEVEMSINKSDGIIVKPKEVGELEYKMQKKTEEIIFEASSKNDRVKVEYDIKQN